MIALTVLLVVVALAVVMTVFYQIARGCGVKRELEAEKQRANQLSLNCDWLIKQTDAIHASLCFKKRGTWQQRAEFAVAAAAECGYQIAEAAKKGKR